MSTQTQVSHNAQQNKSWQLSFMAKSRLYSLIEKHHEIKISMNSATTTEQEYNTAT